MALTVGELNAYLRLDDGTWKSSLDAAGAEFQRFKSRIDVQLQELEKSFKELSAEVKITADTKQAEKDVKAFIRRMNALKVSINVNVSIAAALTRLQQIEDRIGEISRLSASIRVSADTGDTLAALRAVRDLINRINGSRPSVTVNANTGRAEAALRRLEAAQRDAGNSGGTLGRLGSMLSDIGSAAGGAAGSLASVASTAGLVAAVIGAAVPVVAGLVAALVNIAPAAAVGASAVFSLAGAFGAIKLGTGGIGAAFRAAFAPAVSGGGGAAKSAGQAASAMRAVKDATQQAAYANQAAARQVSDAERNVADAQKAAKQAQLDLNDAREQATRDLEDLNDQLADARLDEQSATDDVTTALDALNAARQHGTGPGTDLDALQLAYDKAVQQLKEAREQTDRLSEDTTKANKAGVDGSQTMIDARQKISDANRALSDQERALSDARVQQARTAAQGQEQIQKAIEALNAAGASAGGGGGGVNALAAALAKLSPNARAFVLQVLALRGAWTSMQQAIQQKLFDGLATSLKGTATAVLPVLRTNLVSTAGALNLMALGVLTAARNLAQNGTLGQAMASASSGLHNLAGVPGLVITGLTQLAAAAGPAFQSLTAAAGRGAASIADKLTAAFKSGGLKSAIDNAISLIKQMGQIAGNVGSILGSLFGAANQSGAGFLNTLQTITGALATAFKSDAVQDGLHSLFQTMSLLARTAGPLLIQALQMIAPVLTTLAPPVQQLITALGGSGGLGSIISGLAPVLLIAASGVGQLLTALSPALSLIPLLLPSLTGLVGALSAGLQPIAVALQPVLRAAVEAIVALAGAAQPLLPVVSQLITGLGPLLTPVLQIVTSAFQLLAPIIDDLGMSLLPPLMDVLHAGVTAFKLLAPVISQAADALGNRGLRPVLNGLVSVFTDVVQNGATMFLNALTLLLPVVPQLLPYFVQLGQSVGTLLEAVAPLIPQLTTMGTQLIMQLLPALLPLIPPLITLSVLFLQLATGVLTKIVIPALSGLIKFMTTMRRAFQPAVDAVTWLTTKISGAFEWLYDHLVGHSVIPDTVRSIVSWFAGLPGKAWSALSGLASRISGRAVDATNQMLSAVQHGLSSAVSWISGLPGRASNALGDLSGVLWKSGQALLKGFIDGIKSMGSVVNNAVSSVVSGARDFFPFSPARRGPFAGKGWTLYSGQAVGAAMAAGLMSQSGRVGGAARALAASAHDGLAVPGTPTSALTTPPRGAAGRGRTRSAAGGQGGDSHVYIHLTGSDDAVVQAVRKGVSVRGGNVQLVLGRG